MIQLFMQQGHSLFVLKRKVNPRGVTMCAGLCPHNMNNTFTHTHAHTSAKQVGFFLFFLPPFRLSLTCWQGLPWWRALKDLRLKSAALLSWRRKWTISGRQADWTELPPPRLTPVRLLHQCFPPPPPPFQKTRTCSSTVVGSGCLRGRVKWFNGAGGHQNAESQIYWEEDRALHHVLFPQKGKPGGHFMMLYWPYGHPPPLKQTKQTLSPDISRKRTIQSPGGSALRSSGPCTLRCRISESCTRCPHHKEVI